MKKFAIIVCALLIITACDKGYQIRFNNLYTEAMDSIVVGNKKIIFTNIERGAASSYTAIARGQYDARCVSHSKKRFTISFFVSGKGTGTKTIQVDASGQTQLLEE